MKQFKNIEDVKIMIISEALDKSYDISDRTDISLGFVNTIKRAMNKQTSDLTYTMYKLDKESR